MADRADITPELLRQLLRYEPDTGKLFWLERVSTNYQSENSRRAFNTHFAGKEALKSRNRDGYCNGWIFQLCFQAHRVAYALYYGTWPKGNIDHINGNPSDNRITNLRVVTHTENARNARRRKDNGSGHTGVHWRKSDKKWTATIGLNGIQRILGYFAKKEDAIAAREIACKEYGYHENHGRASNG